ncbi:MAG: pyruvate, phosphate dikinase [Chloroflexota bacterium]
MTNLDVLQAPNQMVANDRWVYLFSDVAAAEVAVGGDWEAVRSLLGGKGANLGEMTRIGIPVPPGFTITTEACNTFLANEETFPANMWEQVLDSLDAIEDQLGKTFGDVTNPLLLSVRSGAKFSMPGMMDTILNLGMNDEVATAMVRLTNDETFVYNAYRRLVQLFGSIVMGIEDEAFEDYLTAIKKKRNYKLDTELTAEDWKEVLAEFKRVYQNAVGDPFPADPYDQLRLAIQSVFKSWNGKRAIDYRNAAGISHTLGTGVNVQTMVFGNMGEGSGTGVAFTRNPSTGENVLFGDYLINAQGEDVVAGIRTPEPIAKLNDVMPEIYAEFVDIGDRLEDHYKEMQDVEFTIERGKLWMLQTRDGKRTARAAIRIAVEMAEDEVITRQQAVLRVSPAQVSQLLHPQFDEAVKTRAASEGKRIATGVNASPGAAVGVVAFDADLAEKWGKAGKSVIMVRPETKPDDVHGMLAAKGILTNRGGATSHAAVVARQFGVPCVCGAEELEIDIKARRLSVGDIIVREGDTLSIDGGAGEVYLGEIPTVEPDFEHENYLQKLLGWADQFRKLDVYANADYPTDARRARSYGARGIGLCRTEHMFFQEERLPIVQRMILSEPGSEEEARELAKLLHFQHDDFYGIFRAMEGLPVIIRLIDPPLHEFMPDHQQLAMRATGLRILGDRPNELTRIEEMMKAVEGLQEFNPMLGFRGARIGVVRPAINAMQVRAIFEAACQLAHEGLAIKPEIMIPLASHTNEVKAVKALIDDIANEVMTETNCSIEYKVGTMIELPRAAITADKIAEDAEFFSFGTNDLTQTTFGISRDDAESKFLLEYVEQGILAENPFQVIDEEGVGYLVETAVRKGRAVRPDIHIGICGEHGGEPKSIDFCHRTGLDYVSCSPFRVPIARLATAHSALLSESYTAK